MRLTQRARNGRANRGFTMAELAVTMLIVFVTLVALLEGLNKAKLTAWHSRNLKVATQLGLYTLGQIESGVYSEELDGGFMDSYAEQGYDPQFWYFEVAFGDETLMEMDEQELSPWDREFDSFNPDPDDDEEDEEEDLPFEKVKVRVHFPKMQSLGFRNYVTIERWIPWEQVYGLDEEGEEPGQ
jgi:hypothetical protein